MRAQINPLLKANGKLDYAQAKVLSDRIASTGLITRPTAEQQAANALLSQREKQRNWRKIKQMREKASKLKAEALAEQALEQL